MCGVLPMVCRTSLASIEGSRATGGEGRGDYVCGPGASRRAGLVCDNGRCLRRCRTTPSCAPACAQPTDVHAGLADAPGRPLPARVPRHARQGRQLHGPGHEPGLRHRGHAAAARALSARRRDPVLRHPDRARRDGPGPVVRRGRRPALRAAGARRSRGRARSPCPTWPSCATCSTRSRRSAARSTAACR